MRGSPPRKKMGSSLYVEVPGEPPFEVRLDKDVVSVGRAEENVLGLRDMNVSRLHFVIERREHQWLVRDKGSRNGTLVNRQPVYDKVLRDGDRIEVGGSALTFRAQASRLAIGTAEAPRPKPTPQLKESSLNSALPQPPVAPMAAVPLPLGPISNPPPLPPAHTPVSPPPIGAFAASRATGTLPQQQIPATAGEKTAKTPGPMPARDNANSPTLKVPPRGPQAPPFTPPAPTETPPTAHPRPQPGAAMTPPTAVSRPAPLPEFTATPAPRTTPLPAAARHLGPVTNIDRKPAALLRTEGKPDRWKKLAELTAAINQEHDLDRLLERIVDGVLSLVQARGAFLVTYANDRLEMRVARNFDTAALDDPNGAYRLSYQTCREAIESKKPILTRDAQAETDLQGFESISNLKLKAILCVPFGFGGEPVGVVYLDEPSLEGTTSTDVIELVGTFGDLAGIAFANARHLEEVKRRERLSEELKIASRIQRKLLPETAPAIPGLELAGRTIPAEEVGGDVYDFFLAPSGDLFVSIGDVSGKGAGAGIVMASVRALLRAYCERETRTDKLLVAVNRALVRDLEKGSFVSLLLLRYTPTTRALAYAGAGHEHLLLVRAKGGPVETLRSGGVVLGLAPDLEGKVEEKNLALEAGDQVVMYTDGATEAATPEGEELGLERLAAIVAETRASAPPAVVAHVIDRVQRWTGAGHPPRDDLTVVALKRL